MATIVTRAGKGSALTFAEMDANFTNINNELANVSLGVLPANSVSATELDNSDDYTVNTLTTTGNVIVGDSLIPSSGNLEINTDYLVVSDASGTEKFKIRTDVAPGADQILKYNSTTGFVQWANDAAQSGSTGSQSGSNFVLSSASDLDLNNNKIINAAAGSTLGISLYNDTVKVGETTAEITATPATDLVLSTSGNNTDIVLKIKDTGGTLQTAATLRDYSYTENATDGDSGTAATNYKPVLDVDQGIRIGNDSANFSSTDEAGNNNTDDFNQMGIIVDNGDEYKWPQMALTSYGGANPLRNRSGDTAIGGTQTVTGLSGTGGTGSSATFDVFRNGLAYEKPTSGNTDGINNAGSGYTAGDTIVITGDNFSNSIFGTPGQTPENDLTVTVDTVDGSGAITAVSFSGTAQGGLATHYSTSAISLRAASGTSSSPQRLFQGARIGQISFTGYDGNKFGGTNAIASASLTVEATEHFSTTNARGAKAYFDILKTGGAATDGDQTGDRIKGWSLEGDELTVNPDSKDLDFVVHGDTVDDIIKVDASNESFSSASAKINFTNLPTSDPAVAGRLWNDSGTLKVSAG